MATLLSIYGVSVVASMALAAGLALLGAHLAARDRAMQTLCVGQGAMLGVLIGIGVSQTLLAEHFLEATAPLILAVMVAAGTFYVSEVQIAARSASRNTHFAALFAVLLAGGYLVSALFPALESHMAQKFFGDLATLSQSEAWTVLAGGAALVLWLTARSRAVSRDSFAAAILGAEKNPFAGGHGFGFAVVSLLALSLAVQSVGFLFTVACLFVPTAFVSRLRRAGLRRHLVACAGIGALAAGAGFLASLYFTRLPTVPAIVAVMALLANALLVLRF